MTVDNRIKGTDIFNQASIDASLKKFQASMKEAGVTVDKLKQDIRELNDAFRLKNITAYNAKLRSTSVASRNAATGMRALKTQSGAVNTQMTKQVGILKRLSASYKKLRTSQNLRGSTGGSASGLIGSTGGIIAAAYAMVRLGKEIYNVAKQLDTMYLTLGNVTTGNYEVAYSMDFLRETAERLGLDLLKTASKFSTFRASAKESGFTLKETMDIFESFSAAGANMGKSTAELDRIFLAIEQMMSKGVVSSEELRRQLGEVLPGAVSIMAKSMGVSTQELQKMLKAGEVLTKDVLPDFAQAILDAYGVDVENRIETIASSQNRLTTAWTEFIEELTGEKTKNAISAIFTGITNGIKGVSTAINAFDYEQEKDGGGFWNWIKNAGKIVLGAATAGQGGLVDIAVSSALSDLKTNVEETDDAWKELVETMKEYKAAGGELGIGELTEGAYNLEGYRKAIDTMRLFLKEDISPIPDEDDGTTKKTKKARTFEQQLAELKAFYKAYRELVEIGEAELAATYKEEKQLQFETFDELLAAYKESFKNSDMPAEFEKVWQEILATGGKSLDEAAKIVTGSFIDVFDRALGEMQSQVAQVISGQKDGDLKSLTQHVEGLQAVIDQLVYGKGLETLSKKQFKEMVEYLRILNPELAKMIEQFEGFAGGKKKGAVGRFSGLQGIIMGDVDGAEAALEIIGQVASIYSQIDGIIQTSFENRLTQIDIEQERTNAYYDDKMTLAGEDADLQAKLEIQREEALIKLDKQRKKIEYEQAKAKKASSIIDATINTALGVTSALSLPPPASFILSALVAALGAAEIATISAQPLPKYAQGTSYHQGGLAVLGDGGRNELAIQPDGSSVISGRTDEIHNLQRGSKVIPDAQKFIHTEVVKSIIAMDERRNDLLVEKIAKSVVDGFAKAKVNNRNNVKVNVGINHQLWVNSLTGRN